MEYDADPIELKSGELGCPRCNTQLVGGKVPYFVNETKVGEFDGLVCEICSYGLLSEKGYEDSGKKVKEMGLDEVDVMTESINAKIDPLAIIISPTEAMEYSVDKEKEFNDELEKEIKNIPEFSLLEPLITSNKNKIK